MAVLYSVAVFASALILGHTAQPAYGALGDGSSSGRVASVANAATDLNAQKLAAIKAKSVTAVQERIAHLDKLAQKINEAKYVTEAHKSALNAELKLLKLNLQSSADSVVQATDLETARRESKKIVTDNRIYVLETPKVKLILALDAVEYACNRLDAAVLQLQQALDALVASGKDVTAQNAALQVTRDKVTATRKLVDGQADAVLSLTASGFPANRSTLQSARTHLRSATTNLKSIRDNLQTTESKLRS